MTDGRGPGKMNASATVNLCKYFYMRKMGENKRNPTVNKCHLPTKRLAAPDVRNSESWKMANVCSPQSLALYYRIYANIVYQLITENEKSGATSKWRVEYYRYNQKCILSYTFLVQCIMRQFHSDLNGGLFTNCSG